MFKPPTNLGHKMIKNPHCNPVMLSLYNDQELFWTSPKSLAPATAATGPVSFSPAIQTMERCPEMLSSSSTLSTLSTCHPFAFWFSTTYIFLMTFDFSVCPSVWAGERGRVFQHGCTWVFLSSIFVSFSSSIFMSFFIQSLCEYFHLRDIDVLFLKIAGNKREERSVSRSSSRSGAGQSSSSFDKVIKSNFDTWSNHPFTYRVVFFYWSRPKSSKCTKKSESFS